MRFMSVGTMASSLLSCSAPSLSRICNALVPDVYDMLWFLFFETSSYDTVQYLGQSNERWLEQSAQNTVGKELAASLLVMYMHVRGCSLAAKHLYLSGDTWVVTVAWGERCFSMRLTSNWKYANKRRGACLGSMAAEVEHQRVSRTCLLDEALEVALDVGSSGCICTAAIVHEHRDVLGGEPVALREEAVHGLDIIDASTEFR